MPNGFGLSCCVQDLCELNHKTDAIGISDQADTLVIVSRSEIVIPNTHLEHKYDPFQERAAHVRQTTHVPEHCPSTKTSAVVAGMSGCPSRVFYN